MIAVDWDFFIAWLLAPGFGLLTILYLQRRGWRRLTRGDRPFLAYLTLGLLWGAGVLFAHARIRDLPPLEPLERLAPYLLAFTPALLLLTTVDLVRSGQPRWRWLSIVPALLIVFAVLHDATLRPDLAQTLVLGARRFDRDGLWRLSLLAANLTSFIVALRLSLELYRQGWGLMYRNRLRYWSLALLVLILGDFMALVFSPPNLVFYLAGLLRLGGATMATATLLIPYLPTTNDLGQRLLSLATMGALIFGLLLAAIFAAQAALPGNEGGAVIVGAAFVSAIVTLVFLPLQRWVRGAANALILGHQADLSNVLAEYDRQIDPELDLKQLAEKVMSLLSGALHLEPQSSVLILANVTAEDAVGLTPIGWSGCPSLPELVCEPDSPLATHWRESAAPLSQFDIDVLPDFAAVPGDERQLLTQWGAELYLPLRTPERLVGLLVLGAKRSGDFYHAAEVRFLNTLAGKLASTLEQARTLNDLKNATVQLTRLSDELAQINRRLYEADRLKSGFINVVAHQLRAPFVSLARSFQLIEQHGLEHWSREQREQLAVLQSGIIELKQMVDHIIAFASLLGKQGELEVQPLDLGAIIAETIKAIRPLAESQQITLDARVWPGLPTVVGDRERLAEAIYHLTHNAIKFNRPGGWVRIRCQPDNGNVEIRVQDNGTGVPADRLEHLWTAFAQTDDLAQFGVEGLGLGLALVRYVAVAHGGEVWAESTAGEGSTFGLRLPASHTSEAYRSLVSKPVSSRFPQRS